MARASSHEVRKTVTILFCDVVHSTALAEGVDPESLRRVMSRYFDEMRAAIEGHGGTVEKFSGDEVMAVFGVPRVHEDDALRAVRAAEEMRERLARLNDELERGWGVRLEIRIGINTGEVVAGDSGTRETFVTGEPVVLAKRLEQAAAPGTILIGKATYPLVKDAVKVGPLERFSAKGKREDAERRRVHAIDREAPGVTRRLDVPMVGRERELELLQTAFTRAVEARECRLCTVLGSAGIGKSRLALELIATVGPARCAVGRCLPYGEGITFWPIAEIVRDLGGEDMLGATLAAADETETSLELIRSAIGTSSAQGSSEETFWAVRRLFEALAWERPLIVCFEDIHWAEPTLLDLIEYVVGWSRGAPILVLCLARPELVELRPTWVTPRANADVVALEPLSAREADTLLERFQTEGTLTEESRRRIAEAAEGNPLFVEQMGALAAESNGDDQLQIPPSIHALLVERLDRLTAEERTVVERAAVIGRDFSARAVAELTPPDERDDVARNLFALTRKQLIRPLPTRAGPEDRFRFQHVLVRDAAYDAMPKQLRAELNERLADSLEQVQSGHELEALIGYHLEQAHHFRAQLGPADASVHVLAERGASCLASAGRRALGRGDTRAAAGLLQRAVALLQANPGGRGALLPDLGAALRDSGELATSDDVLSEAIAAARVAGDRGAEARAKIERAFTRRHRLQGLDQAREVADETLPVLMELADDVGIAKALTLSGQTEYVRCRISEAEALIERALLHAERGKDRQQARTALALLAKTNLDGPRPAEDAIAHHEKLARRLPGDRTLEAVLATTRAPLEAMRGRVEEARALYKRAQVTLEELGRSLSLANVRCDSGAAELLAGDARAAEEELRWGLEALEAIGETGVLSSISALLGRAVLAQGRIAEAERYAVFSEELTSREDVFAQIEWRTVRAGVCARTDRLAEAERVAREAVELSEGIDALNLKGDAFAALGEALQGVGRFDEARKSFAEAHSLYARKGNLIASSRLPRESASQSPIPSPSRSSTAGSGSGLRAGGT